MKCEGIQGIRRLTKHHPEVLTAQLHTVTLAIIAEVCYVLNMTCCRTVGPLQQCPTLSLY